jgi:hypothetical protein
MPSLQRDSPFSAKLCAWFEPYVGMPKQIVQKAEQLDAASSGNMTTVRMAVHAVKSASSDNVFCVPDTPRGSVVVPG